ncbi:hypothetical protein K1T71_012435 [Dendrolimus kikuchii]|uniref:Uncharacterized protein n=1 Tax=Dendrolimus kikuchii TaxID=765133 RepID=A0ACC1CJK2_9NEOP|nr:hypothetical protein K1T71_012435 [Dendrolimus kikuchii]
MSHHAGNDWRELNLTTGKSLTISCCHRKYIYTTSFCPREDSGRNSAVQAYLHNIESDVWEEDEKACVEATKDMLNSVTNRTLWAAWIWNSMHYPTGVFYGSRFQMGNYDQCLNPPWLKSHPNLATQYCVVEVHIAGNPRKMLKDYGPYDNVSSYLQTASKSGRHFNKMLLSLCVSKKCQHKTVEKLSRHWLQGTLFSHPKSRDDKLEYCTDNSVMRWGEDQGDPVKRLPAGAR